MFLLRKTTGVLTVATVLLYTSATVVSGFSSLSLLARLPRDSLSENLEKRCETYERILRNEYPVYEQIRMSRVDLFRKVSADTGNGQYMGPEEIEVFLDCMDCIKGNRYPPLYKLDFPPDMFDHADLINLSEARSSTVKKELDERCKVFDERLRFIFKRTRPQLARASSSELFNKAIETLEEGSVPMKDPQSILQVLKQCAEAHLNFPVADEEVGHEDYHAPKRGVARLALRFDH